MSQYIKTVYSLFYPETKKLTEELWESNPIFLYQNSHNLPKYQTEIEKDFKSEWILWSSSQITFNSRNFNFYNTAGSSEAIRESLADYKASGGEKIYIFDGDYEGYQSLAEAYDLKVIKINRNQWKNIKENEINSPFYFSNPSSIDGNVWEECSEFLSFMSKKNPLCKIRIDLCYLGCSSKELNLNLDSVDMIFFSLSKVYGVYFHRIGGVFSKKPLKGLIGNQWFKNLFSLYLGIHLLKKYPLGYFPKKYKQFQMEIINHLNQKESLELIPSDVIILAYSFKINSDFLRGNSQISRFCITPKLYEKFYKDN